MTALLTASAVCLGQALYCLKLTLLSRKRWSLEYRSGIPADAYTSFIYVLPSALTAKPTRKIDSGVSVLAPLERRGLLKLKLIFFKQSMRTAHLKSVTSELLSLLKNIKVPSKLMVRMKISERENVVHQRTEFVCSVGNIGNDDFTESTRFLDRVLMANEIDC